MGFGINKEHLKSGIIVLLLFVSLFLVNAQWDVYDEINIYGKVNATNKTATNLMGNLSIERNFTVNDSSLVRHYRNITGDLEWITPEHVFDIDDADIETDLNTYVDIAGDVMTGNLTVNENISIGDRLFGLGSSGGDMIFYNLTTGYWMILAPPTGVPSMNYRLIFEVGETKPKWSIIPAAAVSPWSQVLSSGSTTGAHNPHIDTGQQVEFRDVNLNITSYTDGELDINADSKINLNKNVSITGNVGIRKTPVSPLHLYENTATTKTETGLTIEQDGAGDAIAQFVLTGGKRWYAGIDNSHGGVFRISQHANGLISSSFEIDTSANLILNEYGYNNGGKITCMGKVSSDTITDVYELQMNRFGANGAAGLGANMLFRLENGAGAIHDAGKMAVVWTDPTSTSEDAEFHIQNMKAGSFAKEFVLNETGIFFPSLAGNGDCHLNITNTGQLEIWGCN